MKYFFAAFIISILSVVIFFGFRGQKFEKTPIEIFPDMDHQPKFKAQAPSDFYADNRSNRMPVEGTISFDQPRITGKDQYLNTGMIRDAWGDGIPVEVDEALLQRGQERYDINCKVCHGITGLGNGVVTNYGLGGVANLTDERISALPDGDIFNTIGKGKGQMGPYPHIKIYDRWAIVAYVRALQMKQNGQLAAVAMPLTQPVVEINEASETQPEPEETEE
ncbi:MAG: cytochrome c [Verrucomicrobiota bacterium]